MSNEQKQLLENIGKHVVWKTGKKNERLSGVIQAVLPDGRVVVKDDVFGKLAIWPKGTWKVASNSRWRAS